MSHRERELEAQLAEVAREDVAEEAPAKDFDLATFVALKEGRLEPEAAELARRDLMAEPELIEAMQDLERLEELEALAEGDSTRQEAAWERFEAALGTEAAAPETDSRTEERPWTHPGLLRQMVSRYPLASIAATFLLSVGLTWQVQKGFQEETWGVVESKRLVFRDAESLGASRSQPVGLRISKEAQTVLFFLEPPPALALDFEYPEVAEVELRFESGVVDTRRAALQDEGSYLLLLRGRELVSRGTLEIRLKEPSTGEVFASYDVTLSVDPP